MKIIYRLGCLLIFACNSTDHDHEKDKEGKTKLKDTAVINKKPDSIAGPKKYTNERFRDVSVEKLGENKFRISGKAQIFEASFSWVVEDGHNEIKSGHQMTDAGAPEWGNFEFTVEVEKKDPASTLHIILFETSAKDGSRQFELPLLLY
jgi:hypothetical protein